MKKTIISVLVATIALTLIYSYKPNDQTNDVLKPKYNYVTNPSGFIIRRGVNISHWLSQSGEWSRNGTFFNESDIFKIKSFGFDHIRLPIDEEVIWKEDGTINETNYADLKKCLDWCMKDGLNVIVDLHILRSHHFNSRNNEGKMTLWTDTNAQRHFLVLWDTLSGRLHKYPNNRVSYEMMNEPVAPEHEMWNVLINNAVKHIRKLEPNRVIMMGSNRWQKPFTFPFLKVPEGDKNIILTFHSYHPYFVTHYGAQWSAIKDYKGPVHYPGQCMTKADYDKFVDTSKHALVSRINEEKAFDVYNKEEFQKIIQPAIDKAKQMGLQLYCSEFGCLPFVGRSTRLAYYQDITDVFRQNNICWSNWDYKGQFKIVKVDSLTQKTLEPDKELIGILVR